MPEAAPVLSLLCSFLSPFPSMISGQKNGLDTLQGVLVGGRGLTGHLRNAGQEKWLGVFYLLPVLGKDW